MSIGNLMNAWTLKTGNDKYYSTFTKRNIVQCSPWDIVSGISSIVGGGLSMITGGRDTHNAVQDNLHATYKVNGDLLINGAIGTLEDTKDGEYKVKAKGTIPEKYINKSNMIKMPGAKSRISEGVLNAFSGAFNLSAGIATLASSVMPASIMYGIGALSSGTAAAIRFIRSRNNLSVLSDSQPDGNEY